MMYYIYTFASLTIYPKTHGAGALLDTCGLAGEAWGPLRVRRPCPLQSQSPCSVPPQCRAVQCAVCSVQGFFVPSGDAGVQRPGAAPMRKDTYREVR